MSSLSEPEPQNRAFYLNMCKVCDVSNLLLEQRYSYISISSWNQRKKSHFFTSIHLDTSFCHLEVLHFWLSLFNEAAKRNDPSRGFHQLNMHAGVPTWGRSAPLIHKWSQYFILICSVLQSVWHGRVPKPQRTLTKAGHLQMLTPPDPTGEQATFLKMKPDGSSYQSAALDDPLSAAAEMEWEQLSSEVMHFSTSGINQTVFFNFCGKDRFQLVKGLSDAVCAVNHFSDYLPTEVVWCPHFFIFLPVNHN